MQEDGLDNIISFLNSGDVGINEGKGKKKKARESNKGEGNKDMS